MSDDLSLFYFLSFLLFFCIHQTLSRIYRNSSHSILIHSQRALAEVTEMIRTSHLVHKGMVNIYPGLYPEPALNDMTFGNKIALLSGDYLLANSCMELAALRNQDVSDVSLFKLFL